MLRPIVPCVWDASHFLPSSLHPLIAGKHSIQEHSLNILSLIQILPTLREVTNSPKNMYCQAFLYGVLVA